MENKENRFIHHEVLHIPQMKWSVPGLQSFTCSLARGSNKTIQRLLRYTVIFVIWQTYQNFHDQLPGTQGMVSLEDCWSPKAGHCRRAQIFISHSLYHTKLMPTRHWQCWHSNFYWAALRQESTSCFEMGLCHSNGPPKICDVDLLITSKLIISWVEFFKNDFFIWDIWRRTVKSIKVIVMVGKLRNIMGSRWNGDKRTLV